MRCKNDGLRENFRILCIKGNEGVANFDFFGKVTLFDTIHGKRYNSLTIKVKVPIPWTNFSQTRGTMKVYTEQQHEDAALTIPITIMNTVSLIR